MYVINHVYKPEKRENMEIKEI